MVFLATVSLDRVLQGTQVVACSNTLGADNEVGEEDRG